MDEIQEQQNTFSIVMPTCERPNLTIRAIQSIQGQFYQNWELIVVEDGSRAEVKGHIQDYIEKQNDVRIKLIHHDVRMQRLVARNTGIKAAQNDWMCHIDSDDEYLRTYLNSLNWAINEYPDYDIFHFGALVCTLRNYRLRESSEIKELENELGMEKFKSGVINLGSFIYKRKLHDEIGYFPEFGSPYKFSDFAKDEMPECLDWYGPKYMEGGKELGNPWGDDWYLFYKLTRKHKSKDLPFYTYLHYIRRGGFLQQDDDKILNRNNVVIA